MKGHDQDKRAYAGVGRRGIDVLHNPFRNKSTAFTLEEREALGLTGLLPPAVSTQDEQVSRVLENYGRKTSDLERFIFLNALHDRNEKLFFRLILDNIEEMMPIIYTPTVGEASRKFAHIFRRPRGLYVTVRDRGRIESVLRNWPHLDVRVIVVTDGERILGLGDLGANGMGIPVGKLALYTACGGIDPAQGLPVMLDVGTNNQDLLDDPLYLGLRQRRIRGPEYDELIDEFVESVEAVFPDALIQFEDFLTPNAHTLLERYRDRSRVFNDDIQGTAAVALAGIVGALRISGGELKDQKVLFLGAGSAATGIGDLLLRAMVGEELAETAARASLWFVDQGGLVVKGRDDLAVHKLPYAQDQERMGFLESMKAHRPTVLIGATGHAGAFTEEALRMMAHLNRRPIVFALSNPTSKAECTAAQAYEWTDGRAVFASGSPFSEVEYGGRRFKPGQGNNAYIFPGVGLGVVASGATRVTEKMFLVAAATLAGCLSEASLAQGAVYPPLREIREVSVRIATEVARVAYEMGLAEVPRADSLEDQVRSCVFSVAYDDFA